MLAGSVPSSAFTVYAESSITYGSSDDDVNSYAEGYEDAYSDAGDTDQGLIYGTDEEPASYEEHAYSDNLPAGDALQGGVPGKIGAEAGSATSGAENQKKVASVQWDGETESFTDFAAAWDAAVLHAGSGVKVTYQLTLMVKRNNEKGFCICSGAGQIGYCQTETEKK